MHHFISESPWDHRVGFDRLVSDTSKVVSRIECDFTGLLIDESAYAKKEEHSVGVSRQWCGTLGRQIIVRLQFMGY
jgi:SRSO17 transposase